MRFSKFFAKIKLSNPVRGEIAILYSYDRWVRTLVLQEMRATTLPLLPECIYITPQIICLALIRFRRINLRKPAHADVINWLKNIAYQISAQYIGACLDYVGAKVVLTNIDNSTFFQRLSHLDGDRTYFAIQNGTRTLYCVRDSLPAHPHPSSKIAMTNYFCFGQREIDLYTQQGHHIDQWLPVGSLVGGYFKSVISTKNVPHRYDLCLVSQWHEHFFDTGAGVHENAQYKRVGAAIDGLNRFIAKLIDETDLSLVVCLRSNISGEREYYEKLFRGKAIIPAADLNDFSTYRAAEQSRLVVALNSTTLSEILSWKHKVLWCNLTNDEHYEMTVAGICYFSGDDYEAFRERVSYLLNMPQSEFEKCIEGRVSYINNFNPASPPHQLIRSKVIQVLMNASKSA